MKSFLSQIKSILASIPGWVWTVIKGIISAGLVLWLILGFNWSEVSVTLAKTSWMILAAWIIIWSIAYFLMALRMKILLGLQDIRIPYRYAVRLVFIGVFTGNFLPSSMGGDAVKFAYLARAGYSKTISGVSLVIDRLMNIFATFLFLPFALAVPGLFNIDFQTAKVLPFWIAAIVILVGSFLAVFIIGGRRLLQTPPPPPNEKTIKSRLSRAAHRLASIAANWIQHPWITASAMGLALVSTLLCFIAGWILALGLGINISLISWFATQACLSVLVFLPISFNGLGLQEVSMVYLMAQIGIPEGKSLALALLMRVLVVVLSLFGAYGLFTENQTAAKTTISE